MEEKTNCHIFDADLYNNCFVEKTEIEKPFESYMCFDCGMTSNDYYFLIVIS